MDTNAERIRRDVERLRRNMFALRSWHPSSALLPRSGNGASVKYHGQTYDAAQYELVEGGWGHDHCPFCQITVCDEAHEGSITEAYTDGHNWVCPSCFKRHLGERVEP